MYSQQELDDAVDVRCDHRRCRRRTARHVERQRSTAIPDEEQFRLITGFNDIFVAIAAAILLFAVGWIGQSIGQSTGLVVSDHGDVGPSFLAPLCVAATAWGLALFFTARRRMALPSILLLLAFVGGVLRDVGFAARADHRSRSASTTTKQIARGDHRARVSAAIAAGAAWLHWRRFHVPITVAAGAAAVAGIVRRHRRRHRPAGDRQAPRT